MLFLFQKNDGRFVHSGSSHETYSDYNPYKAKEFPVLLWFSHAKEIFGTHSHSCFSTSLHKSHSAFSQHGRCSCLWFYIWDLIILFQKIVSFLTFISGIRCHTRIMDACLFFQCLQKWNQCPDYSSTFATAPFNNLKMPFDFQLVPVITSHKADFGNYQNQYRHHSVYDSDDKLKYSGE